MLWIQEGVSKDSTDDRWPPFRTFNVIDDFNRETPGTEIDSGLPAKRVIRSLDNIALIRGYRLRLRLDNGPELVSFLFEDWIKKHGVIQDFIQPGKPAQNSYLERFNRIYLEEVLDFYIFSNLEKVREIKEKWLEQYNKERPHQSLNNMTPAEYKLAVKGEKTVLLNGINLRRPYSRGRL